MSNGIYIHIPFCLSKCAYCDFNSKAGALYLAEDYITSLIGEMKKFRGITADSVYIGGGTPTVLSDELTEKLLYSVNDIFSLPPDTEFTVESNPATADVKKYRLLKKYGVNRLSIGVQSFNDNELLALSRIHSSRDAVNAVLFAKESGFTNIGIDLMEGIPEQTLKSLEHSLEEALKLDVKHISVYSLIIEEGTPFYKDTPPLPSEDKEREMYSLTKKMLSENGFLHYEISNYAKEGFRSRHNTKYWTREDYYGFGAGAHSFYGNVRYENIRDIKSYIASCDKTAAKTIISETEAEYERFMLGFRMLDGFDTKGHFKDKINKLKQGGLIVIKGSSARLSERGEDLANLVFMEFLGDD